MSFDQKEITGRLLQLDGYEFEQFIAELWERRGYETEVTSKSNDRGVDVAATKSTPYPEKEVIQAKRNRPENRVSSSQIQQYASLIRQEEDTDKVVVVTTSGFTDNALSIAKDTNVKCVDGVSLAEMIDSLGARDLVEKYSEPVDSDVEFPTPGQTASETGHRQEEDAQREKSVTLVGRGDILSMELVGYEDVETEIAAGSFLRSSTRLDGYLIALKIFNQSNEEFPLRDTDEFTVTDDNGDSYYPINLGGGTFGGGWEKHGGKHRDIDPVFVKPGSSVKYALGVSMPGFANIQSISMKHDSAAIELDFEDRQKVGGLPDAIQSSI